MHPDRLHPFDLPIQRILVDLETHLPPWMKIISQSNESAFTRLSNEIAALADLVSPTSKERLVRKDIIHRLQAQVRKIWPTASVVPIGSYAQELYTSSSDMDLFVCVPDIPESLENLEMLYNVVDSSSIASPGTLNIVRGARVPIVKYIDARGSGIQIDVSMNNVSATSSTEFIKHYISKFSVLRPLTMVLKQWLFQRKMNEVYSRGGLSSYALFLLVLTVVHEHKFESSEALGRYLVQFLRQWGSPTAFSDIIRPLHGYLDKSALNWKDPYQPFSLCIQDPVSEHNCIGRQTFSIREIQQEWQLSLNALSAAIDEYERNINGGREKSILASIVGLTTREYESRKQINSVSLPETRTAPRPVIRLPAAKVISPPVELNPVPAKRTKFRNMLTRNGGLIENEEVKKILESRPALKSTSVSLLNCDYSGTENVLLNFDQAPTSSESVFNMIPDLNESVTRHGLEELDFSTEITPTEVDIDLSSSTVPSSISTPILPAINTPRVQSSPTTSPRFPMDHHLYDSALVAPLEPTLKEGHPRKCSPLLDLDIKTPSEALVDLAGLALFQSNSLEELVGLDFHFSDEVDCPKEAILFQGRHLKKSSHRTSVGPDLADNGLRMFSQGIKSTKREN